LKVGCAGAYVLKALADANLEMQITGADIFTEGLRGAKSRMGDRAAFIQTNATKLPYF
jgi:ubiquinone/menaquinone biosynthesis C-methylase UbiE